MKTSFLAATLIAAALSLPLAPLHAAVPEAAPMADEKAAEKTYEGTLETGMMAIGGETTGTILKTKDGQFELDVQGKADLQKAVESLNGKKVTVVGVYKPKAGVEVKERKIILVSSLKEAK